MGGEALKVSNRVSNERLEIELGELEGLLVCEMKGSHIKRILALIDGILDETYEVVLYRHRLSAAHLLGKVMVERIGRMTDEQRLLVVQKLAELGFDDEREMDAFEIPMVLEVAETQEMIALSISADVVSGVNIQEEIVGPIQDFITILAERADLMFENAVGDISYKEMESDDEIIAGVRDDLDWIF